MVTVHLVLLLALFSQHLLLILTLFSGRLFNVAKAPKRKEKKNWCTC